jgi:pimeloyl-ACP methyl ester carboxylesterase
VNIDSRTVHLAFQGDSMPSRVLHVLTSVVSTLSLACGLAACGVDASSTASNVQKDLPPKAMMVVMGGFNSCHTDASGKPSPWGMPMFQAAEKAASQAHQANPDLTVSWFISCHTTDDIAWFITSEHPTVRAANLADVPAWIEDLKRQTASSTIHALGHSYGGWLSMKALLALAEEDSLNSLFTVDPISRVDCSFTQPQGCLSAPRDITAPQRQILSKRTGTWKNFFQTQTSYLHSSAIPEADANLELATTHTRMDTDATVWRFFGNDLARSGEDL